MSENNIKKLQKIDLEILKKVLKIFDKYNLSYYILGGTMLGAIRHKGFIPWDDDIDLGMPRKDYENFLLVAPDELKDGLKIINYRTNPEYTYYITRVLDTNSKVVELRYSFQNKTTYAAIDIFPLDGTPNNKILRKMFILRVLMHRAMMALHYKDTIIINAKRNLFEKIFLKMITKLPTDKFFNAYKQKEIIDKLLKKYNMFDSKYSGNIMGAYRDLEIVPTKYYGKKHFEFENLKLRGIEKSHDYLKHLYGNYLKLPQVEDRKIHYKLIE